MTQNDLIAYFPEAWVGQHEFLCQSFQDIPQDEPALIRALLDAASDRTILGRFVDHLRRLGAKQRAPERKSCSEFSPFSRRSMPPKVLQLKSRN